MKFNEHAFRAAARITAAVAEEAELELKPEAAEQTADFFDTLYRRLAATASGEDAKPGTFELYTDSAGEYRFRLKAANGEIIAASEGYTRKDTCLKGVESVKHSAPDARILEK